MSATTMMERMTMERVSVRRPGRWGVGMSRRLAATAALVFALLATFASVALAGPVWRIDSLATTTARQGDTLRYIVQVTNTGDAAADASADPFVFTVTLPPGLTAADARGAFLLGFGWDCSSLVPGAQSFTCVNSSSSVGPPFSTVLLVDVSVDASSGVLTSRFDMSGGGASPASAVDPTTITSEAPRFGIDAFDGQAAADAAGTPSTLAGDHPYSMTTSIDFNSIVNPAPLKLSPWPAEPVKDVVVDLPVGLSGDPTGVGQCSLPELANGDFNAKPLCPPNSQIGTTIVRTNRALFFNTTGALIGPVPVFNMVPPPDAPARFGFNVAGSIVTIDAQVRSATDYGLTAKVSNIPEALAVTGTSLTLWGVPGSPAHDFERACPGARFPSVGGPTCTSGGSLKPFLRNPTSCTDPGGAALRTTLLADSWFHPGDFKEASFLPHDLPGYPSPPGEQGALLGITDCERVPFNPGLSVDPALKAAGKPTGLSVDVTLPQTSDANVTATSDLRTAVVRLPLGTRVNPSSADGLSACSESQIGLLGTNFPEPNRIHFTEDEPTCPAGSQIGTVTVETPALEKPLEGTVFLASQGSNPFGSLLAIYLYIHGSGVSVKLAGHVEPNPETGQLTTVFDDNPQVPFSNLHLQLKDGPRAPLVNPSRCGTYTTHSEMTGWSGKTVESNSSFTVSGDGHGAPCAGPKFSPGFTAGTQNPVAGGFSPFGLQLTRTDDDGEFSSLSSLSLPPGLLANVASVKTRCTVEQADAHSCPADSHIGEVTTGAGAGTNPFYVGGDVYLTGPYEGNPFGIAVIVHAVAGPFDLGYVVVKGAIQIHDDGSVTVATDPFPTILQGIPLQVRDIRVNLDRPGFTFNPTSCEPASINGTVFSTTGQQANVSSRFQVGECANLAFKPKFTASTAGKTSKANGASFHVHLASNEGPHGTGGAGESNIAKVDVQLPVSLPARLTTLQKACTAAQFASNPAGCPQASFVGSATAHTPILASPLSGPAILVSHGGQAFPDLVLVLQGEGVRLNLTGHTQIKKGITFSHFETVPDAPVASFDLTLPQGPHSALTTDVPGRNLCANTRTVTVTKRVTRRAHGHNRKVTVKAKKAVSASLLMPTTLTAQNGAVVHQNTKIAVTGCAKVKVKASKKKQGRAGR